MSIQAVQAIPAVPPRYGLLVAAAPAQISAAPGAPITDVSGIEWSPEQFVGGGISAIDCDGGTAALGTKTNPANTTAEPFNVWAEDHCSTFGFRDHDFEGRARRALDAVQSAYVAREFWLGEIAQAAPLQNDWLTQDPKVVTGAAVAPLEAMAELETGLAAMLGGRRGMIHCTPGMMIRLLNAYVMTQVGTQWLTPVGTVVVADAGYPGTGPDPGSNAHEWMYATSMVAVRLGEVMLVPGSDWRATTAQQRTNSVKLVAQRPALVQWDSNAPAGTHHGVLAAETTVTKFAGL